MSFDNRCTDNLTSKRATNAVGLYTTKQKKPTVKKNRQNLNVFNLEIRKFPAQRRAAIARNKLIA